MNKEIKKERSQIDPIDRCNICGRGYNDWEEKKEHLCYRCKEEAIV